MTMYEDSVVQLCSDYAGVSHKGQFRKDKITPYITHPARVASMVSQYQLHKNYIVVAAAWLHDVMEDCLRHYSDVPDYQFIIRNHDFDNKDIRKFLLDNPSINIVDGKEILEIVSLVTLPEYNKKNKDEVKDKYYRKIAEGNEAGALIKFCDRIDNLTTVHHFSQAGFKWYIKDTERLIERLSTVVEGISPLLKLRLDRKLEKVKKTYIEMYE